MQRPAQTAEMRTCKCVCATSINSDGAKFTRSPHFCAHNSSFRAILSQGKALLKYYHVILACRICGFHFEPDVGSERSRLPSCSCSIQPGRFLHLGVCVCCVHEISRCFVIMRFLSRMNSHLQTAGCFQSFLGSLSLTKATSTLVQYFCDDCMVQVQQVQPFLETNTTK